MVQDARHKKQATSDKRQATSHKPSARCLLISDSRVWFIRYPGACGFYVRWHLSPKSIAMTNKEILQADLLDILFEHRNKAYGAYLLKKTMLADCSGHYAFPWHLFRAY